MDFFIGSAIHDRVQRPYPKELKEVKVWKDYKDNIYGDFKGTGSIDMIDAKNAMMLEIKSIMSLKWVLLRNAPLDDHVYQINTYYEWGMYCKPEIFSKLKLAKIVYLCKTKYSPGGKRYKEFDMPLTYNADLTANIHALHKAVMTNIPPPKLCKGLKRPTARKFPCGWCASFDRCLKDWKSRGK